MTPEEAIKVLEMVFANTSNLEELRFLRNELMKLKREAQIDFLVRNFTVEELRQRGFNI